MNELGDVNWEDSNGVSNPKGLPDETSGAFR